MFKYTDYEKSAEYIKSKTEKIPHIAVVLGSGMGDIFMSDGGVVISYKDIPNFPKSTAPSHKGEMIINDKVIIMSGRFHYYEGLCMEEITYYVRVLKLLGVDTLILTNAAGGVNTSFKVGDLMLIEDHIKFTTDSPLRGVNDERFGERFTPMTDAYSKRLMEYAKETAKEENIDLVEVVYFYMSGPSFETSAEIRAIRIMGSDAVGMSTVPECIAARHAGIEVMGISCITNMAAGIEEFSGEDVIAAADKSKDKLYKLISGIIERTLEK